MLQSEDMLMRSIWSARYHNTMASMDRLQAWIVCTQMHYGLQATATYCAADWTWPPSVCMLHHTHASAVVLMQSSIEGSKNLTPTRNWAIMSWGQHIAKLLPTNSSSKILNSQNEGSLPCTSPQCTPSSSRWKLQPTLLWFSNIYVHQCG